METHTLGVSSLAMAEVAAIALWWKRHRQAAPELFKQELDNALLEIARRPEIAPRLALRRYPKARAYQLPRTGYVVVYNVDTAAKTITIMRVRHGKRKPLKAP